MFERGLVTGQGLDKLLTALSEHEISFCLRSVPFVGLAYLTLPNLLPNDYASPILWCS